MHKPTRLHTRERTAPKHLSFSLSHLDWHPPACPPELLPSSAEMWAWPLLPFWPQPPKPNQREQKKLCSHHHKQTGIKFAVNSQGHKHKPISTPSSPLWLRSSKELSKKIKPTTKVSSDISIKQRGAHLNFIHINSEEQSIWVIWSQFFKKLVHGHRGDAPCSSEVHNNLQFHNPTTQFKNTFESSSRLNEYEVGIDWSIWHVRVKWDDSIKQKSFMGEKWDGSTEISWLKSKQQRQIQYGIEKMKIVKLMMMMGKEYWQGSLGWWLGWYRNPITPQTPP